MSSNFSDQGGLKLAYAKKRCDLSDIESRGIVLYLQ